MQNLNKAVQIVKKHISFYYTIGLFFKGKNMMNVPELYLHTH